MHKIEKDRLFTSTDGMDFSREYYLCDSLGDLEKALGADSALGCESVEENDGSADREYPFYGTRSEEHYRYAYDVPDELRGNRLMRNIELARWLAEGNGLVTWKGTIHEAYTYYIVDTAHLDDYPSADTLIRSWDEDEWHSPWKE